MDNVHYTLNFGLGIARRTKPISTAKKIVLKLVKWQSLVVNVLNVLTLNYAKYSLVKVCMEFVYIIVLRSEKRTAFEPKLIQIFQTSQGYILRIPQHFASKLCNFTLQVLD